MDIFYFLHTFSLKTFKKTIAVILLHFFCIFCLFGQASAVEFIELSTMGESSGSGDTRRVSLTEEQAPADADTRRNQEKCPQLHVVLYGAAIGGVLFSLLGGFFGYYLEQAVSCTTSSNTTSSSNCNSSLGAAVGASIGYGIGAGLGAGIGYFYQPPQCSLQQKEEEEEELLPESNRGLGRHVPIVYTGEDSDEEEGAPLTTSAPGPDSGGEETDPEEQPSQDTEQPTEQPGGPPTTQVQVHVHRETTCLIQKYNPEGQFSSLLCMQGILLGASEQVVTSLKLLAIKASEDKTEKKTLYPIKKIRLAGPMVSPNPLTMPPSSTIRMFSSMHNASSSLGRKHSSGSMGMLAEVIQGLHIGLGYSCYKDPFKEHSGINLGSATSLVKAKTTSENFATILSLNPYNSGITAHLATSYGWGKVKNIRKVFHGNTALGTKGSPDITLAGGLLQLGYNVPLSNRTSITPFVESVFSKVCWNSYTEKSGALPCKISKNKEVLLEHSIGLRNHWKVTETSQLQAWISNIFGHRNLESVHLQPLHTSISHYTIAVPDRKLSYSRIELGLTYELTHMDALRIALQGKAQFSKKQKPESQHISVSLQYVY